MFKTTHRLEMRIKQIEFEHLSAQLQQVSQREQRYAIEVVGLHKTLKSQQETIKRLTDELCILRNTFKAPVETDSARSTDHLYNQPDVVVADETVVNKRAKLGKDELEELERELNQKFSELAGEVDTSNVTPEALAEATIPNEEEWRRQHSGPEKEDD